jgi:hypothetical protein
MELPRQRSLSSREREAQARFRLPVKTISTVSVVLPADDDLRMSEIDERMDNGALVTGAFRKWPAGRYSYIIE